MSDLLERDISTEEYREYEFSDGKVYRINGPVTLFTRVGGTTHRVVDSQGVAHCIPFPFGSTVLRWKNFDKAKPVNF